MSQLKYFEHGDKDKSPNSGNWSAQTSQFPSRFHPSTLFHLSLLPLLPNLNKLLTCPTNKDRSCTGWHHRGLHLNLFVLCRNSPRVYSIYKTLCPTRFLQTAALDHLWRRKNGQHPDIIYLGRHVKCLNMKLCTR